MMKTKKPDSNKVREKILQNSLLLIVILLLSACSPPATVTPLAETESSPAGDEDQIDIFIFYTNDEHGWMEGVDEGRGAAELTGLWDTEDIGEEDIVLVFSGGDNWTGPAISTWTQGESMIEVMNAMGYDASTIGNHEFDFGVDVLKTRLEEASFPYLSANLRYKSNNQVPTDLGVEPYTIIDEAGVQIGVIGLSNTITPEITMATHVANFEFAEYEETLREYVPLMRDEGADLIFLVSHLCSDELSQLSRKVSDLEISFMGGGHCHEQYARQSADTVIVSGGSNLQSYAVAKFVVDLSQEEVVSSEARVKNNTGGDQDAVVAEAISRWKAITDAELETEIGYLENEVPRESKAMENLITASWLAGYPSADIALTNQGGIRDRLPAGPVTLSSIISVMPFDNVLVDISLTGEQFLQILEGRTDLPVLGGIYQRGAEWILEQTGEPIQADQTYSILTTDFLYYGGSGYDFARYDADAYNTSIDWRQPIIDWIVDQGSSEENPLDQAIDELGD